MNINRMIALNNERRKLLNPENEAYYSSMVLFVRTSPIDQRAGEEQHHGDVGRLGGRLGRFAQQAGAIQDSSNCVPM